ncbi:MAG: TrkH family potassium uptake protein [Bdellovibrionaceae bacterium]|nr:TrkH family potassium uptake protein [Bdellovibrionales bacterium]MCB9253237.1 TrkH family potassium uptake protein [Pseudobdellovibrionaceae bacterium]
MKTINHRYVLRLLGLLLLLMSASMVLAFSWSIFEYFFRVSTWRQGVEIVRAFLVTMAIGGFIGGGLWFFGSTDGHFGKREALFLVSISWLVGAMLAAFPFYFWAKTHVFVPLQDRAFLSFVNCYFEAMSGLTTTGATVLSNVESIPRGLLFWRAFTHWLGGLGIVVIFVAVLPSLGGGGKKLFHFESTGIGSDTASSNIKETTRILLLIYSALTVSQIVLMKLVDPSIGWFSCITEAFGTLGTGGYNIYNASSGQHSPAVQWVIILFMILAGINFGLYKKVVLGKIRSAVKDTEFRVYLAIIAAASLTIGFFIYGTEYHATTGAVNEKDIFTTARDAIFQAVSIQTTTGSATANFDQWGLIPKAVLVALMFIGGCGGSTAGGIKVIRVIGALKIMKVELERAFRPSVLRSVRIGTHNVEYHQRISILAYVLGILFLFGLGSVLIMITEAGSGVSGTTAMAAAIATLNNVGPGLAAVGPVENFGWISASGKLILSLLMVIGRLEVFAILVLLMPAFWRSH